MKRFPWPTLAALAAAFLAACATTVAPQGLGGTSWQLVKFQSGDGTTRVPDDRAKYTVEFREDGSVGMRIDCNRAGGSWKSAGPSQLQFGPLMVTRAACPPGSLYSRFIGDMNYVRSYVIRDGHLFLALMADGGIYEFEPAH